MYERIFNVPVNENPSADKPALTGSLSYDLRYWLASPEQSRRSARTIRFDMFPAFDPHPPPGGAQIILQSTNRLTNEVEE